MQQTFDKTVYSLQAVVFREVRSRYVGDPLGYLWTYATPLVWVAIIYMGFTLLGRQAPIDTDKVSFILSGILPYMGFRFGVSAMIRARNSYRQTIDMTGVDKNIIYAAIAIIETYNILILYAVLLVLNAAISGNFEAHNPIEALSGILMSCMLGYALGYFVCSMSLRSEIWIRMTPVALRPSLFVSGVFFTAQELPQFMLPFFVANPLFHIIEYIRSGLFLSYQSQIALLAYPLGLSILLIWIGAKHFEAP